MSVSLRKPSLTPDQQHTRTFLMTGDNAAIAGRFAGCLDSPNGGVVWDNVRTMLTGADTAWEAFVNGFNHPNG